MNQEKTVMSNSSMKKARKLQHKAFMKQCKIKNDVYEKSNRIIIDEIRNNISVHDFNNLDN